MNAPHLAWFTGGAIAAAAVSWVGATLNVADKAPVFLLSLGVGLSLGLLLFAMAQILNAKNRRRLIAGSVVLAALTVASQHLWLYRAYRQQWWKNRIETPTVAIFRPEESPLSLRAYFAREIGYSPRQPALWAVDAALVVAATAGVVILGKGHE